MKVLIHAAALAAALSGASALAAPVPVDSPRWGLLGAETRVVEFQGRQALLLRGGIAKLDDANFESGVIEFDMAIPTNTQSFPGINFRGQDDGNYEHFYVRPHQNGNPDSMQYTPVINGMTGWQIYKEYNAQTRMPINEWFHVRMEIAEDSARIFVNSQEPTLIIHDLKRDHQAGNIILRGSMGGAYFANINIEPGSPAAAPPEPPRTDLPTGRVRSWQVSPAMSEAGAFATACANRLGDVTWTTLPVETNGIANLARVAVIEPDQVIATMARFTLRSDRARTVAMPFGFSDRVRLYLNGALLYSGDDSQYTRDYRFLGTLGWYDTMQLPLRRGANEIVFVVSEGGEGRVGGGWAANAAFPDMTGLTLVTH